MSVHRFFSAPIGTYGNALVNWASQPAKDLASYAHSYRKSAMCLVSFCEERGIGSIDHEVLPILFLYRHSFELYLKVIVYRAAILTINETELERALPRLWREHSLSALTEMAKPIIRTTTTWPLTWNGDLERDISGLAESIDAVDSGSYSFRYPVTLRGQSSLPGTFFTNIFVFSRNVELVLDNVAQFCRLLEEERTQASEQMKLALHPLTDRAAL